MTFLSYIRNRIGEIRNRLTHIGKSEPLSVMSLILIGLLDIFVFFSIQDGIHDQVGQLTSPDEYIPAICQNIVIKDRWVEDNFISKIAAYSLNKQYSPYYLKPDPQAHPVCQPLMNGLTKIRNNKSLPRLLKERQKLEQKYRAYDLYQKQTFPEARQTQITLRKLDGRIVKFQEIKTMWRLIGASKSKADILAEGLRHAHFTYPLKKFGMELMFLLPLFLIFYFWNSVSVLKGWSIQAFLSAHMLVVAFIPIVFRFGELLLDIIPKRFLEAFMQLLKSINLIGIWYYIVIAVAIAATMFIVYIIQKKWFTKKRLIIKRLTKGQCIECGIKMPVGSMCCPYCGYNQMVECSHCNEKTLKAAEFCSCCGKRL